MKNIPQDAKYLRIALALQSVTTDDEMCCRIIETYKAVNKKKGAFSISDAVDIQHKIDHEWAKIKLEPVESK